MLSLRAAMSPAGRFAMVRTLASTAGGAKVPPPSFLGQNNFAGFTKSKLYEAEHHAETGKRWFKYTLYFFMPALILVQISAYIGHMKEHNQPRGEYINYPHMNIRTKEYPWGGYKSLLHNPAANIVPGIGYETEDPYLTHKH